MRKIHLIILIGIIGIAGISSLYAYASFETLERTDGKQMTVEIPDNIEYDKITLDEIQEARERRDG